MNLDVPQKRFTKEEIQRCYTRWQFLRNEHGNNAQKIPEFVFLTRTLQVAAKQQQELHGKNGQNNANDNNNTQASPTSKDNPNNNTRYQSNSNNNGNDNQISSPSQTNESGPTRTQRLPIYNSNNNNPNAVVSDNVGNASPISQTTNMNTTRTHITNGNGDVSNKHAPNSNQIDINSANRNTPINTGSQNSYMPPTKRVSLAQAVSPKSSISNESMRNTINHTQSIPVPNHITINGSIGTPKNNSSDSPSNGMKNGSSKTQTPSKQNPSIISPNNQHSNLHSNQHPNIFTPDQSNLLRAQITALKCLVNHQNVPNEFQSIIQQSIAHPPDFRKMLMSLSEYVRMKKMYRNDSDSSNNPPDTNTKNSPLMNTKILTSKEESHQTNISSQPNQVPIPAQIKSQLDKTEMAENRKADKNDNKIMVPTPKESITQLKNNNIDNDKDENISPKNTNITLSTSSPVNSPHVTKVEKNPLIPDTNVPTTQSSTAIKVEVMNNNGGVSVQEDSASVVKKKIPENQEPPTPSIPIPLDEFRKKNPTAERIIEIEDPYIMVDSYTIPSITESDVQYETLFPKDNTDFTILPSLLPEGIDIHTATEIYQTLIALNLDTAANSCLSILLDDSFDNEAKEKAMADYRALQLLPLQKAIRGHVLQFEWYQNSLLTNTHPNFLSKIRNINIQDTILTSELYERHRLQQIEKKRKEEEIKLKLILNTSVRTYNSKVDIRNKRVKFGHKLITLHGNLEKEEQKRQERKAKERLQALKANDEEAYIKLLDQTKDTRITHLLRQTNEFLDSLTKAVKSQQKFTKGMIESHIEEENEQAAAAAAAAKSGSPIPVIIEEEPKLKMDDGEDSDDQDNVDYYNVAHRVKEEIKQQPSILIGGTLKEYQLKGLQWMVSLFNNHLNGILADEMGLGKTIQTISLLTYLYEAKNVHGPFLVIVPLSTLSNWTNEFSKWAPVLRTVSFKGSPTERKSKQATIKNGDFDVVVTTFEYIIKEKALLSKVKWVHMIIDEGHRMKNAQSKLSLTLNTYYHSDYRLILTGTPLQNNLPELWALLNFVLPKIFNSVKSFDEWFNTPFANTGGQDKIELSEEETLLVIRRLHKVLRPFLLRRLKKDVEKDLPDKVEKVIKCKMSGLQQIMYQQMLTHRRLFVGDHTNKKMVGLRGFNNQLMQLKKICNHPFVFEEVEDQINPTRETNVNIWRVAGKFELLERVLPKLKATGHRALIFFQMTQIMDIMEDFLRFMDIKYLRLDGHTKSDERSQLLKLFNDPNSEYFCFILSTRAGGLGLNLQTADTVIIFDTDWNPHQDLQAQDRAHRIGQKNEVRILRLITEHSVEEAILEKAHKKLDIDGKVIQAGKFDNKSTSEEQEALLRSLLEAEDERKKRREAGEVEEDELNDNELNQLLARNDNELAVFSGLDNERITKDAEQGIKTRLLDISELPEVYSQEIPTEEELKESEAIATNEGRSSRDRKRTTYADDVSEEQWLKQFEISDDDDDGNKKESKKRAIGDGIYETDTLKKIKLDPSEDDSIPNTPIPVTENSEKTEYSESNGTTLNKKGDQISTTAGKTSIKSARTSTKSKTRKSTRGRSKARARGRSMKSKNGLSYNRVLDDSASPIQVREVVASQAEILYEFALQYTNEVGRLLSPIFEQKPSKSLYPDYYLLIKYPIAFENVKHHIDGKLYNSLIEVVEDFHLVFANARVYNTEDSVIYSDSLELENEVIKKYHEITKDLNIINFSAFDAKYASTPLVIPNGVTTTPSDAPSPSTSLASPTPEVTLE